jgi:hypothetical protein
MTLLPDELQGELTRKDKPGLKQNYLAFGNCIHFKELFRQPASAFLWSPGRTFSA